jgi:hypothetical protein
MGYKEFTNVMSILQNIGIIAEVFKYCFVFTVILWKFRNIFGTDKIYLYDIDIITED